MALGGDLTVESEPGKGTVFRFSAVFKTTQAGHDNRSSSDTPSNLKEPVHVPPSPLKILVVEDDKTNRKLITMILKRLGYEAVTAQNGQEALEIFKVLQPDFVLMDVQMPVMDGYEASRAIREWEFAARHHPCHIAALTANILPEDRKRCLRSGMNSYLNKPISTSALTEILRKLESEREAAARPI